jgi:hypothetical protein
VRTGAGRTRHPFEELLETETRLDPQSGPFLNEHFSDLFATCSLGPAFAATCLLLRFDPVAAHQDGKEHPGDARRAHLILRVLEKMNDTEPGPVRPYGDVARHLREQWHKGLRDAGQPTALADEAEAQLDHWVEELYALADREMPGVRYRKQGWLRAQRLADEVGPDRDGPPALRDEDTLADLLNAAWLCRLNLGEAGAQVLRVGERALQAAQALAKRGRPAEK